MKLPEGNNDIIKWWLFEEQHCDFTVQHGDRMGYITNSLICLLNQACFLFQLNKWDNTPNYIYITNWMRFRLKPFKSIQQLFEDGLTVMASRFWTFFGCLLIPLVLLSVLIFGRPTKMWDWRWWYGLDCFPNWKRLVCVCVSASGH